MLLGDLIKNAVQNIDRLKQASEIYIYGAGIIAYGIYKALAEVYGIWPESFVVTDKDTAVKDIERIPVISAGELKPSDDKYVILISTPEVYHADIINTLRELSIKNHICVDSETEYFIMSEYYRKTGRFPLLQDAIHNERDPAYGVQEPDVGVYMAKCHVDPPLKGNYHIPSWIRPIQAGASLTDARISEISDNTGENISTKNRNYSELTATYWVWKNTDHKYKGICHYRRLLVLTDDEIKNLEASGIDAVLPLPFVCMNDTSEQFLRYISPDDYNLTMSVLKRISPEYYEAAQSIYRDKYIYNYNMLIARQKVFDDYCSWMFPLLFEIEKISEQNRKRNDRYIGYIGEILTSLYFLYNKNNMKIVHAMKKWLV